MRPNQEHVYESVRAELARLRETNARLLEACRNLLFYVSGYDTPHLREVKRAARAAIAAAEEEGR